MTEISLSAAKCACVCVASSILGSDFSNSSKVVEENQDFLRQGRFFSANTGTTRYRTGPKACQIEMGVTGAWVKLEREIMGPVSRSAGASAEEVGARANSINHRPVPSSDDLRRRRVCPTYFTSYCTGRHYSKHNGRRASQRPHSELPEKRHLSSLREKKIF